MTMTANPGMSEHGRRIEVRNRTGDLYVIPSWGYLEGIEIRFDPPLANMDASQPYRVIIEPMDGQKRGQVFAIVRDVEDPRLGGTP